MRPCRSGVGVEDGDEDGDEDEDEDGGESGGEKEMHAKGAQRSFRRAAGTVFLPL